MEEEDYEQFSDNISELSIIEDSDEEKDLEDELSYISNSIISNDETYIKSNINKINTNPFLTKFEFTKILSVRTQQIARGCPTMIEIPQDLLNNNDIYYEIAKLEFKQNKIPLMIRRYESNGKFKDIKINDLINKYPI
tara:strand:- start:1632 stop:2045 length:414 start_codon:yes stop_codon:yes gene_type:complete